MEDVHYDIYFIIIIVSSQLWGEYLIAQFFSFHLENDITCDLKGFKFYFNIN